MTPFPPWRLLYPELQGLLDALPRIRAELAGIPLDRWFDLRRRPRDEHGLDWRILPLYLFDRVERRNLRDLPATTRALAALPGLLAATFSRLGPGAEIGPHSGPPEQSNHFLRALVGLDVPGDCALRIGEEERPLREGEILLFDDLLVHESLNRTDRARTVLILDLTRPPPLPLALPLPPWEERVRSWPEGWQEIGAWGDFEAVRAFGEALDLARGPALGGQRRDA